MLRLKNRCYNGGNLHNFKARYTEVPLPYKRIETEGMSPEGLRNLTVYKKYVGDVCVWCGKKFLKEKKNGTDKSRKDRETPRSTRETI